MPCALIIVERASCFHFFCANYVHTILLNQWLNDSTDSKFHMTWERCCVVVNKTNEKDEW